MIKTKRVYEPKDTNQKKKLMEYLDWILEKQK